MKKLIYSSLICVSVSSLAQAGGLERSGHFFGSNGILFGEGNRLEVGSAATSSHISGTLNNGTVESGDIADNYVSYSLGLRYQVSQNLTCVGWITDPYGGDINYRGQPRPEAHLNSLALYSLCSYGLDMGAGRLLTYGGLSYERLDAVLNATALDLNYDTSTDTALMGGLAYEVDAIALRVALTYRTETDHAFDVTAGSTSFGTVDAKFPEAYELAFQTGVAADTLLFGYIRNYAWGVTDVNLPTQTFGGANIASFEDTDTYQLGVARRFSEQLAVSISYTHEDTSDDPVAFSNLSPTTGFNRLTLGANWTSENGESTTFGLVLTQIGDNVGQSTIFSGANFSDNYAVTIGVRSSVPL